ncbi:hypothetical protein ABW19_dt0201778 [Dactylella cylindrospora]|nr:hypothetical protein ABW19_dt0201778 [Dactylella cylindrospora]
MSSPLLTSSSSTGTLVEPCDAYNQTTRRKSSSSHGSSVTMITTYPSNEEEFARFPEAVKRKYFSSVERLRLTQKTNNSSSSSNGDRLTPTNTSNSTNSSGSTTANNSSSSPAARPSSNSSDCCKRLNPLRHHHHHNLHHNKKEDQKHALHNPKLVLAESDALWYLRLPDSIKRKYFSKEERNILQRRCQEIIPDPAERSIYLLPPRFANRSLTTLMSHSSASLLYDSVDMKEKETSRNNAGQFNRPVSRASSVADTTDFSSLALPMQNFETPKVAPAPVDNANKRQFMRRSMSLTKNFRQSRQSFTGFVFTASTPSTRSHSHSHSLSHDFTRNSNPIIGNSLDYEATYWQDPEARHKLRLYLASPQNFDEAVEFGFPSLTNDNNDASTVSKASTKKSEIVETISILTGDTDEGALNTGLRPRPATSGGVESNPRNALRAVPAIRESPISKLDAMNSPQNREMTLRMTLTRKDLRATDDEIYGWQSPSPGPLGPDSFHSATQDSAIAHIGPNGMKKGTATKTWKKIWKKISQV